MSDRDDADFDVDAEVKQEERYHRRYGSSSQHPYVVEASMPSDNKEQLHEEHRVSINFFLLGMY